MSTIDRRIDYSSKSRLKDIPAQPAPEVNHPSMSRDLYVLCDGAIKKDNVPANSRFITDHHASAAGRKKLETARNNREKKLSRKKKSKQLKQIDQTSLSQITSKKPLIWLQKLDADRLAVQWNVPHNIQRNCQDLLLNGDKAEFVLRLYQNISVGKAEWKTSQRTLEYPINILKRKCYVNLENSGGGIFTAEVGVRSENGRYIFIARSNKCSTPRFYPESQKRDLEYKESSSKSQRLTTPKIFRHKSKLDHTHVSNFELRDRDILAESLVSGVYTDFLREGPKVLRRKNEQITLSSVASRADYLNTLKEASRNSRLQPAAQPKDIRFNSRRLDQHQLREEEYRKSPVTNFPNKPEGYIPGKLKPEDIKAGGVMIASMLNLQKTVAIEVFKKGENPSPSGTNRRVVRVQSKKELAKAMKHSGIREKSELILKGRLEPGRRVRVGGLLIDTEADGSFYVSCSIKDGRLHVPVEEVTAIVVE